MRSGIYAIINIINEKLYIGSAGYIKDRWSTHRKSLNENTHYNRHLQRAWNEYGEDNFMFYVFEYCEKEMLIAREQFWLDEFNSSNHDLGYNICFMAHARLGVKQSEETKAKLRNKIISKEHRKIVSDANKKRVGVKYNVTKEHTWRKCKCDECYSRRITFRRLRRQELKMENPELYKAQQKKYDQNKKEKRYRPKNFIIVLPVQDKV